jgi:hypothetical protein
MGTPLYTAKAKVENVLLIHPPPARAGELRIRYGTIHEI